MNFEEWKVNRVNLIKNLQENQEDDSFKNLLSDLYPKKAHFIYELFQNAEDAKATKCSFDLTSDSLIFKHNGREFNEADIRAICGIGKSLKRNDPTKIGQFGVGFKAVFAYTNTPEIHSGGFHFRIKDLIVYEDIETIQYGNDSESIFIFPFNNPDKSKSSAYSEISNALLTLGENTLLFLSSIKEINYSIKRLKGSVTRIEHLNGRQEILTKSSVKGERSTNWLRFDSDENINDGELKKKCRISIAFNLVEKKSNKGSPFSIKPVNRGEVSIYFPAAKESSNLFFHIHAPFASTVARDSIRDADENVYLITRIGDLLVSSLEFIKINKLLDESFISVLPNSKDNLSEFYSIIRDKLSLAFQEGAYVPTANGSFGRAKDLYTGPDKIKKLIKDEDLTFLVDEGQPLWVKNFPKDFERVADFYKDLKLTEWSWEDLREIIYRTSNIEKIEAWFQCKSDEYLFELYSLFGESINKHGCFFYGTTLKIIRAATDIGDAMLSPSEVYLPSLSGTVEDNFIPFVKGDVYLRLNSAIAEKNIIIFFNEVGVKTFDKKEVIERSLALIDEYDTNDIDGNIYVIKQIINFYEKYPDEVEFLRNKKFLLCNDTSDASEEALIISSPRKIYIDDPYQSTGLKKLSSIHKKKLLWNGYKNSLEDHELILFIDLLKIIGVFNKFEIERVSITNNEQYSYLTGAYGRESSNTINRDYSITQIREYIKSICIESSLLIWDALIHAKNNVGIATYKLNGSTAARNSDSQLICVLRNCSWIPDSEGVFRKPEDMNEENLYPGFLYSDENGLLEKINFGRSSSEKEQEFSIVRKFFESNGISSDKFNELFSVIKSGIEIEDIDELRKLLNSKKRLERPIRKVSNPRRREEALKELMKDEVTLEKSTSMRSSIKGLDLVRDKAKEYLRGMYLNQDGKMMCQCCKEEMPFKLPDTDQYYFEAVQIITGKLTDKTRIRLALCPNCSARYQFARQSSDNEIITNILEYNIGDNCDIEINVKLADEPSSLFFVEAHFLDIRVIFLESETV